MRFSPTEVTWVYYKYDEMPMFKLSEYRNNPDRLSDLLPWVGLVAPGVVLNKDGSFQRTLACRGPDTASLTESQLVVVTARLNNALKRLPERSAIYIEAARKPALSYPKHNHYNDPVSWLIDIERRHQFEKKGASFETDYYLTLQFLPPPDTHNQWSKWLVKQPKGENNGYEKSLEIFITSSNGFYDLLKQVMLEIHYLNDEETLTYLHSTISTKHHPIKPPAIPMYLDVLLADTPLISGLTPQLNDYHLRVVSILGFPPMSQPALLEQLNQLPFAYRWMTRFIPIDQQNAEKQLTRYRRQWFSKRKGLFKLLQETMSQRESPLMDNASEQNAADASEALNHLNYVAYGYYTSTIVLMDKDVESVSFCQREIESLINGLGFTTIAESFNAVEAWLSSLPGQAYANIRMPLLHTLNLSHLMPFSAIWPGLKRNDYLNDEALLYTHTSGKTPFRLVNHINGVGHQMLIGPTGSGKSVLLILLALQFKRYKDARVIVFDRGGSFLAPTMGVNGSYHALGIDTKDWAFQPLAPIDQLEERVWACEWLQYLLFNEGIETTPHIKDILWQAVSALSKTPIQQRTMTGLVALTQDITIRQAFKNYTLSGSYGHLFDASKEQISDNHWQCYEMEVLMRMPSVIAPVLSYLFHRLSKQFTGSPTLLLLDEAWLFLENPVFANEIHNWLKSLRKQNVSVIFATQSVEDIISNDIASTLLDSCPSRILLPNSRALEPNIRSAYEKIGLNEKELQILLMATPRKQYYFQSHLGNRLFDLELGDFASAFCTVSHVSDQQMIKNLVKKHGKKGFLNEYLNVKQLQWAQPYMTDFYDTQAVTAS